MSFKLQAQLVHSIREFFRQQNFLEIFPPPLVENPGMETHVHPLQIYSPKEQALKPTYLHTSPEFYLKEVLSQGESKIFSLGYVFRDDPFSKIHRPNFMMLEWYRAHEFYTRAMEDVESLIKHLTEELRSKNWGIDHEMAKAVPNRRTVESLFEEFAGFSILNFVGQDRELQHKVKTDFPELSLGHAHWEWDDLFFLLFLNLIEPQFKKFPQLVVYEYPAPLAALSTLSARDPRVCERFELYLKGIEVANCYNELTDPTEQESRFFSENNNKKRLYNYHLPFPERFIKALKSGLPRSTGGALGVERLGMALNDQFTFAP